MFAGQPLWVPLATHVPVFVERFTAFKQASPHTQQILDALKYRPEDTRVLLAPDARVKGRQVTYAMAFPLTVTAAACEAQGGGMMGAGAFTSLLDSTTSVHVMERLSPSNDAHVSVNMQSKCLRPIRLGDTLTLISRVEKMGARVAFMSAELLRDRPSGNAPPGEEEEPPATSIEEMEHFLRRFERLAYGRHVKCLLRSK
ncbi:thioesterase superfamily protein [Trypanosoma rangeli]|uniref:Thioesterase superfamily protein n=1 Tax=Trypanosoma rangeli TaxID=5698 RepID=A0A422NBM7_TRYRA|nr:thioesterase superfamily protein [Trypanosoma rangeli]RNF02852.1 thioesterase superfamily protein [Trypanosoma rangeli]|eukprot:RNF02852.1 thioesterase superfamily protein [Trypanosoma rangeli]